MDSRYVKKGWLKENDWLGTHPKEAQPFMLNPKKGFIATANNRITPENSFTDIGVTMSGSYRADRISQLIREKIASGKKLTVRDMQEMQYDKHDLTAQVSWKSI